jgi:hypothetical protein
MCTVEQPIVVINGMKFIDITNVTTATTGRTYSYAEAVEKSKGREVIIVSNK